MNALFIEQDERESERAAATKKSSSDAGGDRSSGASHATATANPLFNADTQDHADARHPGGASGAVKLDGADGLAEESTDSPSPPAVRTHFSVIVLLNCAVFVASDGAGQLVNRWPHRALSRARAHTHTLAHTHMHMHMHTHIHRVNYDAHCADHCALHLRAGRC
jgi:hypothetical protein